MLNVADGIYFVTVIVRLVMWLKQSRMKRTVSLNEVEWRVRYNAFISYFRLFYFFVALFPFYQFSIELSWIKIMVLAEVDTLKTFATTNLNLVKDPQ